MRWGASEAQFVRPVHWLLFIHGDQLVPCTILDAAAGNTTYGHRFHHPQAITINCPAEYADKLEKKGYVIADFSRRRERIREQVEHAAADLKGRADLDDALLDEVTALNEWPLPITASFEERFLEVPQEALVLTMKKNQKYFPLFDQDNRLINHFITITNIDSPQPEVIREGNERVVRPRLADAMFFWQQDAKQRLEEHLESLKQVVFQQKLGSMFDKSERVAALAASIASQIGGDQELAQRAGMLSRCDLMTAMVGEFPEMQGVMGRYQAERDGESPELATALEEFYLPRFSGDALPTTKTGIAISLAEKIDSLMGIFAIGQKPTGDKDPFALRRAALGALRILREHALEIPLNELIVTAASAVQVDGKPLTALEQVENEVRDFLLERLKGLCLDQGIPVTTFNAVAGVGFSSIADFDRRLQAVTQFAELPEAEALAAANKRISNIIRKADCTIPSEVDNSLFQLDEERGLEQQIREMAAHVQPLLEGSDYTATLLALAGLRAEVDRFFDAVMVMDEDPKVRGNRLALLNALSSLFLEVADVSQLQA
jgi:glycyl-tRNA synthetase beta chain